MVKTFGKIIDTKDKFIYLFYIKIQVGQQQLMIDTLLENAL